ncbi:EAL domain-containing protein [Faecalicatena sp. AGMB00832]|uniref:EAL domain-containing protein n=1 Tax=Faecalicatena faecalis TaxID=2726362 RepID=A0ABS6D208_9FIRM|nr:MULTISPECIES: EAL domain-containing protein [Faecalicatena]MBU3875632.1 EAL domain-containing protein [Faecalicatena faecalis]MCI6466919.1 EAL domain-containing protein [Faecalicatena sp.]MDY5617627.1 EAL domain-containing protein [Lachnospiraceae bacterium]
MYLKVLRAIYKIENNQILSSIKKGFILLIPVLLVGSFSLLFLNFPVAAFQNFITGWAGGVMETVLNFLFDSTVGFMSVYLVISISYYYSSSLKEHDVFLQVMAMVVSMVCFAASFGAASGSMELNDLGPVGVFTAMFSSIAATRLFYLFYGKLSAAYRFRSRGSDMDYRNSLSAIYPLLFCALLFIGLNLVIQQLFHVENLNDLVTSGIVYLFHNVNDGLGAGVLYVVVLNVLWVFGIHGGNALEQVAQTYLMPKDSVAGAVISKSFLDSYAMIGGCGTSICLLLALLICSRGRENRQLSYSAAPAVIFNINEILVYGLPVVLNPVLFLPFILTPVISLLISYGAAVIGFLPILGRQVTWTTPVFFSGYLSSGSWRGAVVQLVILAAGTAVYAPFICLMDRVKEKQAEMLLNELTEHFKRLQLEGDENVRLLERHDSKGLLARNIAQKLRIDIEQERVTMGYQPQYDNTGTLVGSEALLRWKYLDRTIYPPLVVALAKEDGFYDRLTQVVVKISMEACRELLNQGSDITVSANISADQLNSEQFINRVIRMAQSYGIEGHYSLEVTEEASVDRMEDIPHQIGRLKAAGIRTEVDDFSMGRTSLMYLQNNNFYAVKLDGRLVQGMLENKRNQEIISSIVSLGRNLGFVVIAEYVETEEIRAGLEELGCNLYQGYLYSPAIPLDQLKERVQLDGKKL